MELEPIILLIGLAVLVKHELQTSPTRVCKDCLGRKIKQSWPWGTPACKDCGSTDIRTIKRR